jgi:signal transduction histidine kinase
VAQIRDKFPAFCLALLALAGLYISSVYNYLLFHCLAELFSIVIACGMFMVAWNSRRFMGNHYLLFIGIAYLFVGGLDLVYTLSYQGMHLFRRDEANIAAQFWIAARYMESISLLISPFMLNRRLNVGALMAAYSVVSMLVILSIFDWKIFPDCFQQGTGLTPFKKTSEYIISVILLGAAILLYADRRKQDRLVLEWLLVSIALTIASEIAFTGYIRTYGIANLIGHYFKILSFYFIYKAIIERGLTRPYSLLFLELKRNEEALQRAHRRLEEKVVARTADLQATVNDLSDEVTKRLKAEGMLRQLSRKSIEALESDRKSVAKELHDSIGGSLSAIKFSLEDILIKIKAVSAVQAQQIEKAIYYLADTIRETKRISAQLRPLTLEELGLLATLQAYTRRFADLYGSIRVDLHIDAVEEDIPDGLKIVIYRILQEALNNAGKHSRAGRVHIRLTADRQTITFELTDNGVGFDVSRHDHSKTGLDGYGLQSMRERTEIVGGHFTLTSAPHAGTHIKADFPRHSNL